MGGLLASLFGGGAEAAGKGVGSVIDAIGNAADKLFTSDAERLQFQQALEQLRQRPGELQVELNKIEAASGNWFVAGWRPWIGWVLGWSLAFYYWPQFVLASVLWVRQSWDLGNIVPYPIDRIEGLMELVVAMLGLGTLRTVEKWKGVAK